MKDDHATIDRKTIRHAIERIESDGFLDLDDELRDVGEKVMSYYPFTVDEMYRFMQFCSDRTLLERWLREWAKDPAKAYLFRFTRKNILLAFFRDLAEKRYGKTLKPVEGSRLGPQDREMAGGERVGDGEGGVVEDDPPSRQGDLSDHGLMGG